MISLTTKPKTTAEFRECARLAMSDLRWDLAAYLYQRALDVYPERFRSCESYKADFKALIDRRDACLKQARESMADIFHRAELAGWGTAEGGAA